MMGPRAGGQPGQLGAPQYHHPLLVTGGGPGYPMNPIPPPGQPLPPRLREFVAYILSREGQQAVMKDGKYLPLTAEISREILKKLE